MRVIKDCWASLGVSECQYGAHVFDGSKAMIYVNHWLAAFGGSTNFSVARIPMDLLGTAY